MAQAPMVEVEIPERQLREAGWKPGDENDPCEEDHCGTDWCSCDDISAQAQAILEAWHNDTHVGVYRFCDEMPCRDLRRL